MGGSELVSQENGISWNKKYPVQGIFQKTSPPALFPIRYATRDWLTWRGSLRRGQSDHWGPIELSLRSAWPVILLHSRLTVLDIFWVKEKNEGLEGIFDKKVS
ncbi:MAG: hypothetical protein C0433_10305 [Cyclobacterium sp.]|nr:hypothetical protein [Cyclobacterium sp.]